MSICRLGYERRLLSRAHLGLPLLVIALALLMVLLMSWTSLRKGQSPTQVHGEVAEVLLAVFEFGIAPAAGFAAASLAIDDPARELQLSLPAAYPSTILQRLGLLTLWSGVVCAVTSLAIRGAHYWIAPQTIPLDQLTWIASLLWCVAAGGTAAVLFRSRAAGAAVLGAVWICEAFGNESFLENPIARYLYLFLTIHTVPGGRVPNAPYWLANRLILLTMAGAMLAVTLLLLRRNEALLSTEV